MKKNLLLIFMGILLFFFVFSIIGTNKKKTIQTSTEILSNKKIGWGIKRGSNHEQPDLGSNNKELIQKYNGIAIGNNENKNVYLTFDAGYEAGYTSKLLDILKENDVKCAFFITAHYLNTAPELVQRMIEEGHIVGNHIPTILMSEKLM